MKCVLFTVLIACFCSVRASAENTPDGQPVVLRNADSLMVSVRDSQSVRELSGHVHLDQGNVSVFCDHAVQYMETNHIVLTGSVKIVQGTVTMRMPHGEYDGTSSVAKGDGGVSIEDRRTVLKADNGTYDMKTNQADFFGGVSIEDDSVHIDARTVRYMRATQESQAWSNVVLRSKVSNTTVLGDSARNVPTTSYSVMRGHPVLVHIDTTVTGSQGTVESESKTIVKPVPKDSSRQRAIKKKSGNTFQPTLPKSTVTKKSNSNTKVDSLAMKQTTRDSSQLDEKRGSMKFDTLTIQAEVLESFRAGGEDRFVASRNAEIVRGTLSATAGRCVYDRTAESIDLQTKPRVWADSIQLSADSMWIHLPQRRLRSIRAFYDAFLLLRDSTIASRAHQISGESIVVDVDRDTIQAVRSVKHAKSLYFMSGDSGPDGASSTVCDSLFVSFDRGQLDNIVWRSGVSSEYYPENLVGGGAEKYYLPSYRDVGLRPRKPDIKKRFESLREAVKQ